MISEPDPVYIYLLLGHNAPVRVAVDNLDTTIGRSKNLYQTQADNER